MLKEALKTERLVIKSPEIDDKVELTQLINDYEVVQWLSNMPFPYQLEDAEVFIEQSQEKILKHEIKTYMIFHNKKKAQKLAPDPSDGLARGGMSNPPLYFLRPDLQSTTVYTNTTRFWVCCGSRACPPESSPPDILSITPSGRGRGVAVAIPTSRYGT